MDSRTDWISFAIDTDSEGEQTISIVWGGRHVGGVAQGRLSWSGGMSVSQAQLLKDFVASSTLLFLDGHDQGQLLGF